MDSKDAVEKLKVFLESTPPNIKARMPGLAEERFTTRSGGGSSSHWVVVSSSPMLLELHCDVDDGVRRFDASDENFLGNGNSFQFLTYVCRDCGVYEKTYALKMVVGGDGIAEVMKLGEYPPFGAPISARIQKLLGKNDDLRAVSERVALRSAGTRDRRGNVLSPHR